MADNSTSSICGRFVVQQVVRQIYNKSATNRSNRVTRHKWFCVLQGIPEHEEWGVVRAACVGQRTSARPGIVHTFYQLPCLLATPLRRRQPVQEAGQCSLWPRPLWTAAEPRNICQFSRCQRRPAKSHSLRQCAGASRHCPSDVIRCPLYRRNLRRRHWRCHLCHWYDTKLKINVVASLTFHSFNTWFLLFHRCFWNLKLSNCHNEQPDRDPVSTWLLKDCAFLLVHWHWQSNLLLVSDQFRPILKESVISPLLKNPPRIKMSCLNTVQSLTFFSSCLN